MSENKENSNDRKENKEQTSTPMRPNLDSAENTIMKPKIGSGAPMLRTNLYQKRTKTLTTNNQKTQNKKQYNEKQRALPNNYINYATSPIQRIGRHQARNHLPTQNAHITDMIKQL